YRSTLDEDIPEPIRQERGAPLETDEQVKNWLVASLSFDHYSHKQLRQVVDRSIEQVLKRMPELADRLGLVKFPIRERVTGLIERQTDRQTHAAFKRLYDKKALCFFLECREARFEIPPKVRIPGTPRLVRYDNAPLQRSLFDRVPDDLNGHEKAVALYLDNRPEVLWWYRNLVGPANFAIQGYRRK